MSCQTHFSWTRWKSSLLPNNHKKTHLFSINITNRYQFQEWKIKSDSLLYPLQTNLVTSQGPNRWEPIIKPTSKKPKYHSRATMWPIGKNPTTVSWPTSIVGQSNRAKWSKSLEHSITTLTVRTGQLNPWPLNPFTPSPNKRFCLNQKPQSHSRTFPSSPPTSPTVSSATSIHNSPTMKTNQFILRVNRWKNLSKPQPPQRTTQMPTWKRLSNSKIDQSQAPKRISNNSWKNSSETPHLMKSHFLLLLIIPKPPGINMINIVNPIKLMTMPTNNTNQKNSSSKEAPDSTSPAP